VNKHWSTFRAIPLWLLPTAVACVAALSWADAFGQQSTYNPNVNNKSWTDTITSPFKQGADKLGRVINPKPTGPPAVPEDDATSLKNKSKPGPELYVAIARLYEQAGKAAEAELQYQAALRESQNNLSVLLAYARLKERLEKPDEAIQLYRRAAGAHPQEASVYNNLGLCYARQGRLDEALGALRRATELEPKNQLYRNNIATVLVDQGNLRDAFAHLRQVHGPAAAYYNMGYLLNKKGQTRAALQQFNLAVQSDPSFTAARQWVQYLQRSTTEARLPQHPMAAGVRIGAPPTMPAEEDAPMPTERSSTRRLPPTALPSPADGPALPGISYERPSAPLPPPMTNTALRPLPPVN
jgi:tetratricopeptide (TPR) repeat protein